MNKKLQNIKILVWDLDGTLYRSIPELSALIKKKEVEILARHKNPPAVKATKLFDKLKRKYKSGTTALFKQGCGSYQEILTLTDNLITKQFIKEDSKLVRIFSKLGRFRHLILANKIRAAALRQIKWLGLNPKLFEKIFTIEDIAVTKPSLRPFKSVLEYTKLPPFEHLMIGDRVEVDLIPAKKLGMKTCLVWQKEPVANKNIDITIPTIYDIVKILE